MSEAISQTEHGADILDVNAGLPEIDEKESTIVYTFTKEKNRVLIFKKTIDQQKVNLKKSLEKLYSLGIKSVMVEGGGELIFSLLKDDLVDEINLKIGDLILGGRTAPTLCDGDGFTGITAKQVKLVDLKRKQNYLTLKYKVIKN